MTVDMSKFTTQELLDDLRESKADIRVCQLALGNNIEGYSGGSVRDRLKTNYAIAQMIIEELKLRGVETNA